MKRRYYLLILTYILLQIADVVLTFFGLSLKSVVELNPFFNTTTSIYRFVGVAIFCSFWIIIWNHSQSDRRIHILLNSILVFVTVFSFCVVVNNLIVIVKALGVW